MNLYYIFPQSTFLNIFILYFIHRSYSFEDELTWGAVWLARATGDSSYLSKAENYYTEFGLQYWGGGFSWDSKVSGVEVIVKFKFCSEIKYF